MTDPKERIPQVEQKVSTPTDSEEEETNEEEVVSASQLWLIFHKAKHEDPTALLQLIPASHLQENRLERDGFNDALKEIFAAVIETLPDGLPFGWLQPLIALYRKSSRFRIRATRNSLHYPPLALDVANVRISSAVSIADLHEAALDLLDNGVTDVAEDPLGVAQYLCSEFGDNESDLASRLYGFLRLPYPHLRSAKALAMEQLERVVSEERRLISYAAEGFVLAKILEAGAPDIDANPLRAIEIYERLKDDNVFNRLAVARLRIMACRRKTDMNIRMASLKVLVKWANVQDGNHVWTAVEATWQSVRELLRQSVLDVTQAVEQLQNGDCWPLGSGRDKAPRLQALISDPIWPNALRTRALQLMEKGVEMQDEAYYVCMAELCMDGCGLVQRDLHRAVELYGRALYPKRYSAMQRKLGQQHYTGPPIPSVTQPRMSCVEGLCRILRAEGVGLEQAKRDAIAKLENVCPMYSSAHGHISCLLGETLREGRSGIPINRAGAERIFREGVKARCLRCTENLVQMHGTEALEEGTLVKALLALERHIGHSTIADSVASTGPLTLSDLHSAISVCTQETRKLGCRGSFLDLLGRFVVSDRFEGVRSARMHALNLLQYEPLEDDSAAIALGRILEHGCDVLSRDLEIALEVYGMCGAYFGSERCGTAILNLIQSGRLEGRFLARAVELAEQASRNSGAVAAAKLGNFLLDGIGGVLPDVRRSLELFWLGEYFCHFNSDSGLARIIEQGCSEFEADPATAARLYEDAIILYGDAPSMRSLAALLKRGWHNSNRDLEWAEELTKRAAELTLGRSSEG